MNILFKLLENGRLPQKQTTGSVAFDLFSAERGTIPSGRTVGISVGFSMEMPDGVGAEIRSRSGLALRNDIFVTAGTIDSDYRGPVTVILHNFSKTDFNIEIGNRIAQMIFFKSLAPSFEIVEELSISDRNTDGLGSTGL